MQRTLIEAMLLVVGVILFALAAPDRPEAAARFPELYFLAAPGMPRQDVTRRVQAALYRRGFDPGPIDGLYGGKTLQALQDYRAWEGSSVGNEIINAQLVVELERMP